MKENFEKLKSRVEDALTLSDLERIREELRNIKTPTITTGVGGSAVVSTFASKVLNEKNRIITKNVEPRDFLYFNTRGFENVLSCSYSGNNYGVDLSFNNNLKHYLLSTKEEQEEGIISLPYKEKEKEHSFISLAATLAPCAILLDYYLENSALLEEILNLIKEEPFSIKNQEGTYEIFTGLDTKTASTYLESTLTESGLGRAIIHDKYSYCHGRSTLCKNFSHTAIYLNTQKDLDKLLLDELPKYFKEVIVLDTDGTIIGDFALLIKTMYLTKYLAECRQKDLSGVDYNPVVKKLYKYRGEL